MSWIYGASGGTNFWEEQIKNEKRLKKTWSATYGVDVSTKRAAELEEMAKMEEAAKAEATAKLTARPKLQKVAPTWKTKCGPTGESKHPLRLDALSSRIAPHPSSNLACRSAPPISFALHIPN